MAKGIGIGMEMGKLMGMEKRKGKVARELMGIGIGMGMWMEVGMGIGDWD